jgi:hypothetical protein
MSETQRVPGPASDVGADADTTGWNRDSDADPAALPGALSLEAFVQAHDGLDREAFLAQVSAPHLVIDSDGLAADQPAGVMTQPHRVGKGAGQGSGSHYVVPLRKREGSNSFGLMVTIGRAENNDVRIKQAGISKFHAYARQLGEKWLLNDANSSNGTWLDGRRLAPEKGYPLAPGSVLLFGAAVQAEFVSPAALYDLVRGLRT